MILFSKVCTHKDSFQKCIALSDLKIQFNFQLLHQIHCNTLPVTD